MADTACGESPLTVSVTEGFVQPKAEYTAPDLSPYTVEAIAAKAPRSGTGRVSLQPAEGNRFLAEAFRRERGDDLRQRQGTDAARVLSVETGVISLSELVEQVGDAKIASRAGDIVTLRLPVLVNPGATLVIDGRQTARLRLSTDRGAFLMNAGDLFVLNASVIGWDEAAGEPSRFFDKSRFRPFVASLIRSRSYLAGSVFESLGFAAPTAYGVSLSTQPERLHGEPTDDAPTGVLVGNTFKDLYYGFYSYEARDVAIVDNTYDGCIVYGIDPHDRSTRLLIARNTTTGTRERHGIIGSRGVSESFILDNVSFANTGSGVMLDRQCRNNVVAGNRVYDNGQGVAIYESPDNLIAKNWIADNAKSAIRVRNSVGCRAIDNVLVGNGDYAIEVSARRLSDHDKRMERRDLYDVGVEASFYGNRLSANFGVAKAQGLGVLRLAGLSYDFDAAAHARLIGAPAPRVEADANGQKFGGELKPLSDELLRVLDEPGLRATVERSDSH